MDFVFLIPLLTVLDDSQYGHLKGLPLGINITSAIPARDMKYINVCNYHVVIACTEDVIYFSEDQLKIPFENFKIEMEKPGTFCNPRVLNFAQVYASHFSSTVSFLFYIFFGKMASLFGFK